MTFGILFHECGMLFHTCEILFYECGMHYTSISNDCHFHKMLTLKNSEKPMMFWESKLKA